MLKQIFLVALQIAVLQSCNQPDCPENLQNAILRDCPPNAPEYQQEIRRLIIATASEVDYYFEKREMSSGRNYLVANCYGSDFCGKLYVLMDSEDERSRPLQNDAGYRGAALAGLRWQELPDKSAAVYRGLERVID